MLKIETKGIESIRKEYLDQFNLSSIKDASLNNGEALFCKVIEDFKKGKLSSDDLSTFSFEIFHGIAKRYPKSDLFQASLSASELSFYIRSSSSYKNIPQCLGDIDKFYDHRK